MTGNIKALLRIQRLIWWRGLLDSLSSGKSRWRILLLPLLILPMAPILIGVIAFYVAAFYGLKLLGQGHMTLVLAFTAGQLACLTFGVFYVISAFYYSKDLSVLVPLPIRPGEIVLAKFLSILVGEYLTMGPFVAPALIIYGILADVGPLYWPFAVIIFLLLPVFPLVLAAMVSMLLMRLTNLRRNRDLWRVVGALFAILVGMGFQFFARMGRGSTFGPTAETVQQIYAQNQALFARLGQLLPTSVWAANALRDDAIGFGLLPFVIFLAVTGVLLMLLLWSAEKLFFGGWVGGEESRSSGKTLSRDELALETGQVQTPLKALLLREIRLLNRTPSFLMAGLMPLVIMPFMVAIPYIQGASEFAEVLPRLSRFAGSPGVVIAGLGAVLFMTSISNLAPTAISREGRHFWISRSIPVAPSVQIHAKLVHAMLFATLNIALVVGALSYLRLLTPLSGLYLIAGGLAVSATAGYMGLLIDVLRPNLNWTDPQKAMKGNANGLFAIFGMLVIAAVGALVSLVAFLLPRALTLPVLVAAFAAFGFGLGKAAGALADRKYMEYEE